jgi:glutaredoxin-like protein
VSDADTMLNHLSPNADRDTDITLFARPGCSFCARAKALLDGASLSYEQIVLGTDITGRTLHAVTGAKTVPQVFVNGERIGGADDLEKWLANR